MNLKNKIALVTGGSSGMGEAIAKKLDEAGCVVIITYQNNENGAEDVLSSFQNEGAKFKLDLRKDTDILELFAFIKDKFGKLDILVNNAGANRPRELLAMSTWREIFQINLFGLVMCTDEAVKLMGEGGKILNISSIYGDGPACWKGLTAYGAAKAGVNHFTQTMAKNLALKILKGINLLNRKLFIYLQTSLSTLTKCPPSHQLLPKRLCFGCCDNMSPESVSQNKMFLSHIFFHKSKFHPRFLRNNYQKSEFFQKSHFSTVPINQE